MRKTLVALAALALPGSALAQDHAQDSAHRQSRGQDAGAPETPAAAVLETFDRMDADRDGYVTEEEYTALVEAPVDARFSEAAGEDGKMTPEELAAFITGPMPPVE